MTLPDPGLPVDPGALPVTLARHVDDAGELALRRHGEVLELVVDGVFAMDSREVRTERALAELALADLPAGPPRRVLIGGLGLGFTLGRVLADPDVGEVVVAELHPALVDWLRAGLVPQAAGLLDDPRVTVAVGDVREVLASAAPASFDAVLLDVDNGPGFLVHPDNAAIYQSAFLAEAATRLRPAGVLAVWSCDPAPSLHRALGEAVGSCRHVAWAVRREGRELEYAIYLARRAG